jgi:hypothetical protein
VSEKRREGVEWRGRGGSEVVKGEMKALLACFGGWMGRGVCVCLV